MCRFFYIATLVATLMSGAARAEAIIIVDNWYNLGFADEACRTIQGNPKNRLPEVPGAIDAVSECKLAGGGRILGQRLEDAVINQLAINTGCEGVSVFRQYHPGSVSELAAQKAKFHWELSLSYHPGMQTHGWALYPNDGNRTVPSGALIGEEGTPEQIADHVCIAVKRRGANIH